MLMVYYSQTAKYDVMTCVSGSCLLLAGDCRKAADSPAATR